MDFKEKINKIKVLLNLETEQKFADYKMKDGSILRCDSLDMGAKVMTVSEAGEAPAQDGTYEMEDGKVIVVTGGVISEVKEAEMKKDETNTPEPAKMEETLAQEVAGQVKSITYKYSEMEKQFSEMKTAYDAKIEKLEKELSNVNAINKEMFSLVEKVAGIPATEATQKPKEIKKSSFLSNLREEVKEAKKNLKELQKK